MRVLPLACCLAALPAFAQLGAPAPMASGLPDRTWTLGVQSYGPTLTGRFNGTVDGQPIALDLDSDLGLGKDKASPGFFVNYQGPRFALQVAAGTTDYKGDRTITRSVTVDGVTYTAGTRVQSKVKLAATDAFWTIKFVPGQEAWVGLDLGAQIWKIDLDALGTPTVGSPQSASTSVTAPVPQVGLSAGGRGWNGAVEGKAYVHYLGYKGAKYTLTGVDLRVFPVSWFGLRAFYEGGSFDVPRGSVKDDLEFKLDRKGVGLGGVFRF